MYEIEGCINRSGDPQYRGGYINNHFYEELENFKIQLKNQVNNKECKTYCKMGDGDYFFLRCIPNGSARPGKRALSKNYNEIDMRPFREGFIKNDYIICEMIPDLRRKWEELYPNRHIDVNGEFCYALVHNKWFFKEFKGKIGLIGAKEKLDIIKNLMQHKEYQEYLGLEKFNDYISIPMRFSCDNLGCVKKMVKEQLEHSTSDIFLFGVGHIKAGLIHELRNYKKAVYCDCGGALDGIAGIIDKSRPYAAGWCNYRLKNYSYDGIDFMCFTPSSDDIWL